MADEKVGVPSKKDFWDKLQIVFHPLNGLLTAAAVGLLGYYTSNIVRQSESAATNERVYTELTSSREQADNALRKDMFLSIIELFRTSESADLDGRMLNLELLVYNFHESLNLKPLFAYMERQIRSSNHPEKKDLDDRLKQMSHDIARRQLLLLEQVGRKFSRTIDFEMLKVSGGYLELMPETLELGEKQRVFALSVLGTDPETGELLMELGVRTLGDGSAMQLRQFHLGNYDFPMIDNTRLSSDQRAAVVLTNSSEASADITLVYFPGSYAGIKEKVSSDEVLERLRALGQQPDENQDQIK
jgi:hypothetical protein